MGQTSMEASSIPSLPPAAASAVGALALRGRRNLAGGVGLAIVATLALAPFLLPGVKALDVAAQCCIYIVLAASYDILLGYTGIVSFAHTLFFGLGAYAVAIATTRWGESWWALGAGALLGVFLAGLLAAAIGLFSLRVRAIFF